MPRSALAAAASAAVACTALRGTAAEPLLLSPLIARGELARARSEAEVMADGMSLGYTGYLSVPTASGKLTNNMFFWYQPCAEGCDPRTAEFVQWFQGGPGAPSTYGAMGEIGNFYIDTQNTLQKRCYSWCNTRNCLFVDSPAQTGYSFQTNSSGQYPGKDNVEYTRTSEDAMEQMYGVLGQFLTLFPELQPAPYWITGESYGGNYVAWMAKVVLQHNARSDSKLKVNLKGVSVGDPVLSLQVQVSTYAATMYAMGVLMEDEREHIDSIMAASREKLAAGDCRGGFDEWNKVWNDDGSGTEFLFKKYTGSAMTENLLIGDEGGGDSFGWLANHSKEFHFDGKPGPSQVDEGGDIYSMMVNSGDFCQNSTFIYFKELFADAGLDVNIYSSSMDPLLGPPTTEVAIQLGLEAISQRAEFYKQPKGIFFVSPSDKNPAGYSRCLPSVNGKGNRFCYSIIRNAGHTTPAFTPASAYDMTKRFFEGRPLDGTWHDPAPLTCAACGGVPPFAGDALPSCFRPRASDELFATVI